MLEAYARVISGSGEPKATESRPTAVGCTLTFSSRSESTVGSSSSGWVISRSRMDGQMMVSMRWSVGQDHATAMHGKR